MLVEVLTDRHTRPLRALVLIGMIPNRDVAQLQVLCYKKRRERKRKRGKKGRNKEKKRRKREGKKKRKRKEKNKPSENASQGESKAIVPSLPSRTLAGSHAHSGWRPSH